jgi:hypothetical protein
MSVSQTKSQALSFKKKPKYSILMFKFKSSKTATIVKYLRARIPENMEQQRQRIRKNI